MKFTIKEIYNNKQIPTDYVYKIWLSLLQGQEFKFFGSRTMRVSAIGTFPRNLPKNIAKAQRTPVTPDKIIENNNN